MHHYLEKVFCVFMLVVFPLVSAANESPGEEKGKAVFELEKYADKELCSKIRDYLSVNRMDESLWEKYEWKNLVGDEIRYRSGKKVEVNLFGDDYYALKRNSMVRNMDYDLVVFVEKNKFESTGGVYQSYPSEEILSIDAMGGYKLWDDGYRALSEGHTIPYGDYRYSKPRETTAIGYYTIDYMILDGKGYFLMIPYMFFTDRILVFHPEKDIKENRFANKIKHLCLLHEINQESGH